MTTTTAHRPAGLPKNAIRPYCPATVLGAGLQINRQANAAIQRSIKRAGTESPLVAGIMLPL
jgi:hypothetical protein